MRLSAWSSDVCSSDLLRMLPNLAVYRPADAVETAECWALSLERQDVPSMLCLTRQNLPQLRTEAGENLSARGAYRLRAAKAARKVVLLATEIGRAHV